MKRQLEDRVENYTELINGSCKCGQKVIKVVGSSCTARFDKARFHYPGENSAWSIFRCKSCSEPIDKNFKQEK